MAIFHLTVHEMGVNSVTTGSSSGRYGECDFSGVAEIDGKFTCGREKMRIGNPED